jgi:hypothetical protein
MPRRLYLRTIKPASARGGRELIGIDWTRRSGSMISQHAAAASAKPAPITNVCVPVPASRRGRDDGGGDHARDITAGVQHAGRRSGIRARDPITAVRMMLWPPIVGALRSVRFAKNVAM